MTRENEIIIIIIIIIINFHDIFTTICNKKNRYSVHYIYIGVRITNSLFLFKLNCIGKTPSRFICVFSQYSVV